MGLDLLVGIGSFTSIFMVLLRTNWNDCTSCPYGTFCNQMASKKHMWVNLWSFIKFLFSEDLETLTVYRTKKEKEFENQEKKNNYSLTNKKSFRLNYGFCL